MTDAGPWTSDNGDGAPSGEPSGVDHTPHVLLVDDSLNDAEEAKFFLERSGELQVDLGRVFPQVDDYSIVALDPSVSAVIVDQFLAENTGVPYEGVDVADFLRIVAPALPVFVLTNFAGDLEEQAGAVDAVITKGSMRKHAETYISRILRGIGRYHESLDARQSRIQVLIDLDLAGELDDADSRELEMLRREIERPADLTLQETAKRQEAEIARQDERTLVLEALIAEMRAFNQSTEG